MQYLLFPLICFSLIKVWCTWDFELIGIVFFYQIYLYEVNLDNMADGDDSMYAKRPRHCVPHAIVQFKTKRKQAQAKIQPVSVPVVRILFINIVNLLNNKFTLSSE